MNLSGKVFEDGGRVDGGGGANAAMRRRSLLQETVNTTDRELQFF